MTGPTRAPATLAADLAGLSEQATPGEWQSSIEGRDHRGGDDVICTKSADLYLAHSANGSISLAAQQDERRADQDYIAALVNAHRAGHLVTPDAALDWVAEQLADPEVVEAAARAADHPNPWVSGERVLTAALAALRDRAALVPDTAHAGGAENEGES